MQHFYKKERLLEAMQFKKQREYEEEVLQKRHEFDRQKDYLGEEYFDQKMAEVQKELH